MEPSGLAESPSGFTARKAATWVNANHPDGRSVGAVPSQFDVKSGIRSPQPVSDGNLHRGKPVIGRQFARPR